MIEDTSDNFILSRCVIEEGKVEIQHSQFNNTRLTVLSEYQYKLVVNGALEASKKYIHEKE